MRRPKKVELNIDHVKRRAKKNWLERHQDLAHWQKQERTTYYVRRVIHLFPLSKDHLKDPANQ